jgi:hypothetical protein
MSPVTTSLIVFACIFGGALLGIAIRARLPKEHLSPDTKDVVKLGIGLIATMSALVLGLLIASAKGSFDAQRNEVVQMSANVIFLDRVLAHYGPETKEVRALLGRAVTTAIDRLWPADGTGVRELDTSGGVENLYEKIQELSPKTELQRTSQAQALKIFTDIGQTRLLLFSQRGSSIPTPFLVILVFWLSAIFVSFTLFARANMVVTVSLFVCALSFSCAIFLVLELDKPFTGLMGISSATLRSALLPLPSS